jgi:hypothetical protein
MLAQGNPTATALIEVFESYKQTNHGRAWPSEYTNLYRVWGYFNRIFDILYPGQAEWQRIALFSLDPRFTNIWVDIQQDILHLAQAPCVGDGRGGLEPTDYIRIATRTLRGYFGINTQDICQSEKCQSRKIRCSDWQGEQAPAVINPQEPNHAKFTPLGATLTIVYQVRNNLFHGSKNEYHGEEYERNLFLTGMSASIIQSVVERAYAIILLGKTYSSGS